MSTTHPTPRNATKRSAKPIPVRDRVESHAPGLSAWHEPASISTASHHRQSDGNAMGKSPPGAPPGALPRDPMRYLVVFNGAYHGPMSWETVERTWLTRDWNVLLDLTTNEFSFRPDTAHMATKSSLDVPGKKRLGDKRKSLLLAMTTYPGKILFDATFSDICREEIRAEDLPQHIRQLRLKIEPSPSQPAIILTSTTPIGYHKSSPAYKSNPDFQYLVILYALSSQTTGQRS